MKRHALNRIQLEWMKRNDSIDWQANESCKTKIGFKFYSNFEPEFNFDNANNRIY